MVAQSKYNEPEWQLLVIAILLYIVFSVHSILMEGYFVDGTIYASLARNLAEDYGSFWHLKHSEELFPVFREHPPLGIYIQSIFFETFGDTEWIDKLYGISIGFLILLTISNLNRVNNKDSIVHAWFVILTFILLPLAPKVLSYNWLEHILTLNIVLTALLYIAALRAESKLNVIVFSFLSGLLIFSGILIKGPTATYPLAIPFFWWIIYSVHKVYKPLTVLIVSLATTTLAFVILLNAFPASAEFFDHYLNNQVISSLTGDRGSHSRDRLFLELFVNQLTVPIIIFSVVLFFSKKSVRTLNISKDFYFYLAIALSGSLPLMLSHKQNTYYLFISLPFYALAIATLFVSIQQNVEKKLSERPILFAWLLMISVILVPISLSYGYGKFRKDPDFHSSFTLTKPNIEPRSYISACPTSTFLADWNTEANFQRYFRATLTRERGHRYLVTTPDHVDACVNENYKMITDPTNPYILFEKASIN